MNYLKYFLFSLIILWLLGFLYILKSVIYNTQNITEEETLEQYEKTIQNLKQLESDLKKLEIKNKKNEFIIRNLQHKAYQFKPTKNVPINNYLNTIEPTHKFEQNRRKIYTDLKDVSYYINSKLDAAKQSDIKSEFNNRINIILAELYNLSTSAQLGQWRQLESNRLTQKVQKKFHELQNPKNCQKQPKLVCDLNKACGFGCQIHHVMFCFITAYFTNRTMILESKNWHYNPKGYEAYFKPVSESCTQTNDKIIDWNDDMSMNEKTILMPIIDMINKRPKYFPLSIPKEFQSELEKLHGNPFVWWSGQILSYLMRFNQQFTKVLDSKIAELGFKNSCVGVHVRRTDKVGTEADFHALDEYMSEVEKYYNYIDLVKGTKIERIVYLATDDIGVLKEAQSSYLDYIFIFDETNANSASVNQRYSPSSAQGVIQDIYLLSQCEFLVCTFSSQVCRLAYELMQTRFADASWRFRSLDDVYYFGGQNGHLVQVLYDHVADKNNNEIDLVKGDYIGLSGNHWNGYSKGKNHRTNEEGLFPSYKVKEVVQSF